MLHRQYEFMKMENSDKIFDFFNRFVTHTNVMKRCGEKVYEQTIKDLENLKQQIRPYNGGYRRIKKD